MEELSRENTQPLCFWNPVLWLQFFWPSTRFTLSHSNFPAPHPHPITLPEVLITDEGQCATCSSHAIQVPADWPQCQSHKANLARYNEERKTEKRMQSGEELDLRLLIHQQKHAIHSHAVWSIIRYKHQPQCDYPMQIFSIHSMHAYSKSQDI